MNQMENKVSAKEISAGRTNVVKRHLQFFEAWFGKERSIKEIEGQVLLEYRGHLLSMVAASRWTRVTAQQHLVSLKSFIRWLWQTDAIESLPRVMDGKVRKRSTISTTPSQIVVFTKDEICSLLKAAPDRTQLYILLMLNCGMTQKDIADLKVDEVDWTTGRIIRKRSKTADHDNVPYRMHGLLWPETPTRGSCRGRDSSPSRTR